MSVKTQSLEEVITAAREAILAATTTTDLWKAGQEIAEHDLPGDVLEELRSLYLEHRKTLQTTVKAETLSGKVLVLNRPKYVETAIGPSFFLTGTVEETEKPFECWAPGSASGPVHRFFEKRPPTSYPVRVIMTKGPHPKEQAKTMWTIEVLPPQNDSNASCPF